MIDYYIKINENYYVHVLLVSELKRKIISTFFYYYSFLFIVKLLFHHMSVIIIISYFNITFNVFTVSFEPGSRLSRSITAECEAAAAAVDSVEYESEGIYQPSSSFLSSFLSSILLLLLV